VGGELEQLELFLHWSEGDWGTDGRIDPIGGGF